MYLRYGTVPDPVSLPGSSVRDTRDEATIDDKRVCPVSRLLSVLCRLPVELGGKVAQPRNVHSPPPRPHVSLTRLHAFVRSTSCL